MKFNCILNKIRPSVEKLSNFRETIKIYKLYSTSKCLCSAHKKILKCLSSKFGRMNLKNSIYYRFRNPLAVHGRTSLPQSTNFNSFFCRGIVRLNTAPVDGRSNAFINFLFHNYDRYDKIIIWKTFIIIQIVVLLTTTREYIPYSEIDLTQVTIIKLLSFENWISIKFYPKVRRIPRFAQWKKNTLL